MVRFGRHETGTYVHEHPYALASGGGRDLVVVPGIDDAMWSGTYPMAAAWALGAYFSRFRASHDVAVVSRPRGLAPETTIADVADGYATVIEEAFGTADVLGVSMGGMVAQALAIDHPEVLDRLVLANSGCRFGDRLALDRFDVYARERDWGAVRAELAGAMFTDLRAAAYPPMALTLGRVTLPKPAEPADVELSLEAVRAFDARDRLGEVDAPTLVFGGTADPYFPEAILEATAAAIPDAERAFVPGGKHAAFHERKATFDSQVRSFLGAADGSSDGRPMAPTRP